MGIEIHWQSFLSGTATGAVVTAAFTEAGKALWRALARWFWKPRWIFLKGDKKRLLWLAQVGGGSLLIDSRMAGSPIIWSPRRGVAFQVRGKLDRMVNQGLFESPFSYAPGLSQYRLTDLGAQLMDGRPGYETEFPVQDPQSPDCIEGSL